MNKTLQPTIHRPLSAIERARRKRDCGLRIGKLALTLPVILAEGTTLIQPGKVTTEFQDGVLSVDLTWDEQANPWQVEVKVF